MFSAFLPFFKRSHADSSSEPTKASVDKVRESTSEVMRALVADPSAMQGLKVEMLSDTSSWTDVDAKSDRPAKYETFAARIAQIGATPVSTDEFTLTVPVESNVEGETTGKNSYAAFATRLPESVRNSLNEIAADKSTRYAEHAIEEPASPPVEPPRPARPRTGIFRRCASIPMRPHESAALFSEAALFFVDG